MSSELRVLKERREGKIFAWRKLVERARTEKRRLTEDEKDKCDGCKTAIEELEDEIRSLADLEGAEDSIRAAPCEILAHSEQIASSDPTQNRVRGGIQTATALPGDSRFLQPAEEWAHFGENLLAIRNACVPGGRVDRRLKRFVELRAAEGSQLAVGADGGFLAQDEYGTKIMTDAYSTGAILPLVSKRTIGINKSSVKLTGYDETSRATGSRWGGIRGYWGAEAVDKTKSKPTFRKVELIPKKLFCLWPATDELLEDVPLLGQEAGEAFASEIKFMTEDAIINGIGGGQPLGILNSGCLVTVAKETGQAAATIQTENIVNMWSRLSIGSKTKTSGVVWVVNPDIIPQLYTMGITVGTGGSPIFMPAGGLSQLPYNTILGRPVIETEYNATLGTLGDIILADFGEYLLADKGSVKAASSIHVDFKSDQTWFRWVYRCDGQTRRSAPLTPFKGSATTSPFVTLAART